MGECSSCPIRYKALELLTPEEEMLFEEGCTEVRFETGDKVVNEGAPVTHVVYLKKGVLKVCLRGPGGQRTILKLLSPGGFVGIHDVFSASQHRCAAIAVTPATACFINRDVFIRLVRTNGAFALEMLQYVSQEEIEYLHRFIHLLEKQVTGRVADMILYFANHIFGSDTFPLNITREELGRMIGASRESVSRILKELRQDNILRWDNRTLEILNKTLLEKISRAG